jgi:hypothetical protein
MIRTPEDYASYFEAFHHLIPEISGEGHTQRKQRRESYLRMQKIAPYKGGQLPGPTAFEEVQCLDLSAGGFSYMTPDSPPGKSLIVALGTEPNVLYMTAEIVRNVPLYRVGCRFTGRIDC